MSCLNGLRKVCSKEPSQARLGFRNFIWSMIMSSTDSYTIYGQGTWLNPAVLSFGIYAMTFKG
ncbi:hypothetical protein BCU94_04960 [Shewanella sp. 10N.286.52.C2]|nr:hypothetical protein BCU94_04960 [Shewanella sp. 10N.286.52.C2]PMG50248.1 hypothetical protein BCU91_02000 [Shewanella sp. 10N.286.52.B9]PMH87257.1 hypothetical protein BCU57_01155 [Shewanella sp. 10N.286.48.B5]PMH99971.1 hypothetical protein BCU55_13050 [Shewanella sp. 10N.286.48.A6]